MKKIINWLFLSFVLLQFQSIAALPNYQLIDLGLQKYHSSYITNINNNGWICGLLSDNGTLKIFVLNDKMEMALRTQYRTSNVFIDDSNAIYGSAIFRVNSYDWIHDSEQFFKWINPYKYFQYFHFYHLQCPYENYAGPFDFKTNRLWDLNNQGEFLAANFDSYDKASDEFNKTKTWIYTKNKFEKITHPDFQAGFYLNNKGQVLGYGFTGSSLNGDRAAHLSLYDHNKKTVRQFNFPSDAYGNDINDEGEVIGYFYEPFEEEWHGFVADAFGNVTDLGNFFPYYNNNSGLILGYINEKQIAILENGKIHEIGELTSLVDDTGSKWDSLDSISGMNDKGWIVGQGKMNGAKQCFLLKPIQQDETVSE